MNPALALGGLAVASPILIHLLSRRRFRRVRFAAIEFVLQAYQQNRRRVQMEQWILLALRCLAVLLLALVFSRPFARPGAAAALLGGAARTERIVLLDDSFSTAFRASGRSVFERGVASVRRLAQWLGEESPEDSLTVLLTSKPSEPAAALSGLDGGRLSELDARLRELSPADTAARPVEALSAVADLLRRRPTQANAALYLISDFQQVDWSTRRDAQPGAASGGEPPADARPAVAVDSTAPRAGVAQALTVLSDLRPPVRLVLIDVAADRPRNLAVTGVRSADSQVVAGAPARFLVDVSNYSDDEVNDVEIAAALEQQSLPPTRAARIGPGETVSVPIEWTPAQSGAERLRVGIADPFAAGGADGGDGLSVDNERLWAGAVLDSTRVLIVNGSPNFDSYRDETFLLRTALRPEGQVFSGNDVRVIEDSELDATELAPFHAVILCNVARLSPAARRAIEQYVADGGGLIVFAGDELDLDFYNDALYRPGGDGILPCRLLEVVRTPAGADAAGVGLDGWDESHPIFRPFVGPAAELLRGIRFTGFLATRTEADASDAAQTAGASASRPAAPPTTVLARLADPQHSPLLVERSHGRGKVLFIATTADMDWTDWPRDPSYVPVILQLVAYAARSPSFPTSVLVGEPIRFPLADAGGPGASARTLTPPRDEAPQPVSTAALPGGSEGVTWERTEHRGIYQLAWKQSDGAAGRALAAVNLDPRESDLRPAGRARLTAALPDVKFQYVRDLSTLSSDVGDLRRELWWPLLLAAVGVLMIEQLLAWRYGSRGAA